MTPPEDRDEKTPDDRLRAGARSDSAGIGANEPQTGTTPRAPETDLGVQEALPENTIVPAGADTFDVVGEKKGMFGVQGSGDTSGYGGLSRPIVMPGPSPRPYGGWFDEVVDRLSEVLGAGFGPAVEKVVVHRGEMTIFLRPEHLVTTIQHLRDDASLRFEFCSGVSGVHYPGDKGRELHAVYHLLSMTHNRRIRLEVAVPEDHPHIPSVVSVYPTADWHEREAYDFFGILFDGHPSLTRIMMPDDWPGHPQRKDYPLGGVPVEYKGATIPPPDTRRSYL